MAKNEFNTVQQELEKIARFPDMNPGPVLRMDFSGTVLLSNTAAQTLFGEDLHGKKWIDICPCINPEVWEKVIKSKEVTPIEATIDGKIFMFNHRTDSEMELVFAFGSDITKSKEIERKLEEQKAIISEMARFPEMNPGPVLRLNFDGEILLANTAAKKLFGENLYGRKWREICPHVTQEIWNQIVSSEEVVPVEAKNEGRFLVFKHKSDLEHQFVFVFGMDITLQRLAENQVKQSEKMATLGTLAAGVAHELNNPAAATRRAAHHLRECLDKMEGIRESLYEVTFTPDESDLMLTLVKKVIESVANKIEINSFEASDLEADLEEHLDNLGIEDAWDIAPSLVKIGITKEILAKEIEGLNHDTIVVMIQYVAMLVPIYELTGEIYEGSSRISEIVVALKNYSFLGRAPIQEINIHEGIDNTLVILKNKIKEGITIQREYNQELPRITAYGSELNQVWTNILDNATDAMQGHGTIIIRTYQENNFAVVEIEDNGPGIPENIQSHIFDPFFTTKEPGKGTGLGLSTSYGIVTEKHKGSIHLLSRPGFTKFTIRLPINLSTNKKNN